MAKNKKSNQHAWPAAVTVEVVKAVFAARLESILASWAAKSGSEPTRLLLGCSAGGDSMALLHLAKQYSREHPIKFIVAHLDHAQRPESAAEADAVIHIALKNEIELYFEKLQCAPGEVLSEDAMRQARHTFYRRAAEDFNASAVLLAHHRDDQAETFMIRLLAGSGPTGLGGMREIEIIDGLTILRPLLNMSRAELRQYLQAINQTWHDDPSNDTLGNKRGWLRNKLLPLIASDLEIDPATRIASAAELIASEAGAMREAARLLLESLRMPSPSVTLSGASSNAPSAIESLALDSPIWRGASSALRRQLLREWLMILHPAPHPPGRALLESLLDFAQRGQPWKEHRTVDLMYIAHLKTKLLAFAPEDKGGPIRAERDTMVAALRAAAREAASCAGRERKQQKGL